MAITSEQREQIRAEALTRAVSGQSFGNWPVIIEGLAWPRASPRAKSCPGERVHLQRLAGPGARRSARASMA